jgi:hypothetical protein
MEQQVLASFLMQLTQIHLWLYLQHYAVFKIMVMPFIPISLFSASHFLAHWLIITCWNEQTQQRICQRMTVPTAVYHWQYPLQFINDSTHCSLSLTVPTAVYHWQYPLQFITDSTHCSLPLTVPTAVYHWQYPLQFITDSTHYSLSLTPLVTSDTFQGSEVYSQWHLQQNDAMRCVLACDVLGVWP